MMRVDHRQHVLEGMFRQVYDGSGPAPPLCGRNYSALCEYMNGTIVISDVKSHVLRTHNHNDTRFQTRNRSQ
jgi:hypothetical protein